MHIAQPMCKTKQICRVHASSYAFNLRRVE